MTTISVINGAIPAWIRCSPMVGRIAEEVRSAEWRRGSRTSAGRYAQYAPYPGSILALSEHLQLDPHQKFADLGSGLGLVVMQASLYFDGAVGFELDPSLHQAAEEIRQTLELPRLFK